MNRITSLDASARTHLRSLFVYPACPWNLAAWLIMVATMAPNTRRRIDEHRLALLRITCMRGDGMGVRHNPMGVFKSLPDISCGGSRFKPPSSALGPAGRSHRSMPRDRAAMAFGLPHPSSPGLSSVLTSYLPSLLQCA